MEDILASIRRIIADDQLQSQRGSFGAQRRAAPAIPASPESSPLPAPLSEQETAPADLRGSGTAPRDLDDVLDLARLRGATGAERPASQDRVDYQNPAADARARYSETPGRAEPAAPTSYDEEAADYADDVDVSSLHDDPAPDALSSVEDRSAHGYMDQAAEAGRAYPAAPVVEAGKNDPLISARPSSSVMSAFETLAATVILQNTEMLERIMRDQLRPLIKTWLDDNLPVMVERLVRAEIERVARGGRG